MIIVNLTKAQYDILVEMRYSWYYPLFRTGLEEEVKGDTND